MMMMKMVKVVERNLKPEQTDLVDCSVLPNPVSAESGRQPSRQMVCYPLSCPSPAFRAAC